jgi:hypothetical protein
MNYELDSKRKIYPWVKAFMAVSISQFSQVSDKLDFPFPIKQANHIQGIAHDFAFTYAMLTKNPEHIKAIESLLENTETSSIDVMKGLSTNASFAEKLDTLFTNTFSVLEQMGYADEIYNWCVNTLTYYKLMDNQKYQEVQSLIACFRLFGNGVILDWLEKLKSDTNVQNNVKWKPLIEQYRPFLRQNPPQFTNNFFNDLALSEDGNTILREIVLNHETSKFQLGTTIDEIKGASESRWDEYALYNWGAVHWIRLEGQYRINQNAWAKIQSALSKDDLYQLKEWINQQPYYFTVRDLPLPKIAL